MNISRRIKNKLEYAIENQAAVALLGPRQVGKTTLALEVSKSMDTMYLDLEKRQNIRKLEDPSTFLQHYEDKLVILDEIHRIPDLFMELRGLIDEGRRAGIGTGRFLILGSASMDVLKQSGESLAGRITFVELSPLDVLEATAESRNDSSVNKQVRKLWVRGGFPESYLANTDELSLDFREDFIRTYLERDVPQFGGKIPAGTLGRLWTMLAHSQGQMLNVSKLAANLSKSASSISYHIDLLSDLLLVRSLPPYEANTKKRLVKSPKIYLRDSGILHALLELGRYDQIAGHPVVGASWEGFVVENLLTAAHRRTKGSFFRTTDGAEIDLVIQIPGNSGIWAVDIKMGTDPKPTKGFHVACEEIGADRKFVVHPGTDRFPVSNDTMAIGVDELAGMLENSSCSQRN